MTGMLILSNMVFMTLSTGMVQVPNFLALCMCMTTPMDLTSLTIEAPCHLAQVMPWKVLPGLSMEMHLLEPELAILQFPAVTVWSLSHPSQSFQPQFMLQISAHSLLTTCDVTGVTFPWETKFCRELFSDGPFSVQLVPKLFICNLCHVSLEDDPQQDAASVASVAVRDSDDEIFAKCISSSDDGHYHEVRQQLSDANNFWGIVSLRERLVGTSLVWVRMNYIELEHMILWMLS